MGEDMITMNELLPTEPAMLDLDVTDERFAEALKTAADEYLTTQRPVNTTAGYADDWRTWERFCRDKNLPAATANEDLLVSFVVWMEQEKRYAPNTMVRRVTGTVRTLRDLLGATAVPVGISAKATKAINGYDARLRRARIQRGRGEAALITPEMVVAMVAVQPDTLLGLRNRALLLMWYHLGGRRAELAELDVDDVCDGGTILVLHLRDTKTGEREPVVARKPGSPLCPVAAWYAWIATAGITEGPAFPRMNRHGHLLGRITGKSVGAVVTNAGRAAGIDDHLTGHGMRAGHVTTAFAAGADPKTVALQTGHKPEGAALWRYKRRVDRVTENTSALIDLDADLGVADVHDLDVLGHRDHSVRAGGGLEFSASALAPLGGVDVGQDEQETVIDAGDRRNGETRTAGDHPVTVPDDHAGRQPTTCPLPTPEYLQPNTLRVRFSG